ncbi:MAG: DHH family phosphoesterase [Ruminococcus callidus]
MQELIENSDQVFLMGHRFGDLDSVGSACGLAGAVRLMQKPAYGGEPAKPPCHPADRPHAAVSGRPEVYGTGDALAQVTDNSLLIAGYPHILESVDLYHAARYVIVIDHHRKNVNR